jgi:hypothetical protein
LLIDGQEQSISTYQQYSLTDNAVFDMKIKLPAALLMVLK